MTICLVVSLATWLWMVWREGRIRSERAACVRLLEVLHVDNGNDSASPHAGN